MDNNIQMFQKISLLISHLLVLKNLGNMLGSTIRFSVSTKKMVAASPKTRYIISFFVNELMPTG
jgi:hypothetical protein